MMPDLTSRLASGEAWPVFRKLVEVQGGDVSQIEQPDTLPTAPVIRTVASPRGGILSVIHAREVGLTARDLGAGRLEKGAPIDHAVGVVIHHKVGDAVEAGAPLFTIHARTESAAEAAEQRLLSAHAWAEAARPLPVFYDVLFSDDAENSVR
jgi:pyrimidine-nucleoside phosphorylase